MVRTVSAFSRLSLTLRTTLLAAASAACLAASRTAFAGSRCRNAHVAFRGCHAPADRTRHAQTRCRQTGSAIELRRSGSHCALRLRSFPFLAPTDLVSVEPRLAS